MKRERVNAILLEQKRRKKIVKNSIVIVVILLCSISLLFLYYNSTKNYYATYTEHSNLDYKVYLKQNEFYEKNYLEKDNQYIANLIDYINAQFEYQLDLDDVNVDYQYSYSIDAIVNVVDNSSKNSIFTKKIGIVDEKSKYSHRQKSVKISENIDIDYNYYNDLIKRFISVYDLDETTSTLDINMYVKVLGNCEDIVTADTNKVITLSIPLTTKTVAIDMNYDILDGGMQKVMVCNSNNAFAIMYLVFAMAFIILDLYLFFILVRYIIRTRTAESIYHKELRKILSNYKSYIQKINNELDLKDYKVLKVDTFTDMLEIRDTIQEPILMVENKDNTGVFFLIPSKTKILYTYSIKVDDIRNKMEQDY